LQNRAVAGADNRLDIQDISARHNLATEGGGMSPPKVRSVKRIIGRS